LEFCFSDFGIVIFYLLVNRGGGGGGGVGGLHICQLTVSEAA
jgi:hypothetical protein